MSDLRLPPLETPAEPFALVRARARARIRHVWLALSTMILAAGARGVLLGIVPGPQTVKALIGTRYDPVTIPALRGDILDRNGEKLATTVLTPDVVISPKDIAAVEPQVDIAVNARRLAEVLGQDPASIERRMRGPTNSQNEVVATEVDGATALAVDALGLPGVALKWSPRRFYPDRELAAPILGYLGASDDGQIGVEGIEALFEEALHGEEVSQLRRKKFDDVAPLDAARGSNVWLTIDRVIQRVAEEALGEVRDSFAPTSASAVVMDVKTGEILALATTPTFNPNPSVLKRSPVGDRRNWAVEANFEPGSVMKPFVVAAALDRGLVAPETEIDCSFVPGYPDIGEAHGRFETLTVTDVIAKSSNVGAAKIAQQLGPEGFRTAMSNFGFGQKPGLGLPGEAAGKLDPARLEHELPYFGFGHGMSVSPVQLAAALATIGNDGVRMRPILVSRVADLRDVPDYVRPPMAVGTVVSPNAAAQARATMMAVMGPSGTGRGLQADGYSMAGKTGTASVWDRSLNDYGSDVVASFMALVPAHEPVLSVVVMVDRPRADVSLWGSNVAGPAVVRIAEESLAYLGVPRDLHGEPTVAGADSRPVQEGIRIVWRGEGWAVPDLRGHSIRSVLGALAPSGLTVSLAGTGVVTTQQPPPGAVLRPGDRLSLVLQ